MVASEIAQRTAPSNAAGRPIAGNRPRRSARSSRIWPASCPSRPLLERILKRSTELLGCDAGSICLVDEAAGVYRKEADIGVACQSGKVFPLTEGTTGALVARRGPVIFADYGDVPGGHVRPEDREALKGVIGVPIWWRGDIVGSLVVFTRDPSRAFVDEDAELFELFAKHAAIAITNARLHEAAESTARAEAAAAERNRMAREVHDAVAQGLVSVLLQLRAAQGAIADGRPEEATGALAEARAAAEAVFEETRRSVLGLAPSPLEGRSLEEALELELAWANRTGVIDARLVTAGSPVVFHHLTSHTHCSGSLRKRSPTRSVTRRQRRSGSVWCMPPQVSRCSSRTTARDSIGPRSNSMGSGTASGSVGWRSGPGCWAGRWSSIRHRDGVPGSGRGSRRLPTPWTRSAESLTPCGSSWSTTTR